jgi:hypothetical protein
MGGPSSSQLIFRREEQSVGKMPSTTGKAACEGNNEFDILFDRERVAQDIRNQLARVCATCELLDCGWRQTRKARGSAKK